MLSSICQITDAYAEGRSKRSTNGYRKIQHVTSQKKVIFMKQKSVVDHMKICAKVVSHPEYGKRVGFRNVTFCSKHYIFGKFHKIIKKLIFRSTEQKLS